VRAGPGYARVVGNSATRSSRVDQASDRLPTMAKSSKKSVQVGQIHRARTRHPAAEEHVGRRDSDHAVFPQGVEQSPGQRSRSRLWTRQRGRGLSEELRSGKLGWDHRAIPSKTADCGLRPPQAAARGSINLLMGAISDET